MVVFGMRFRQIRLGKILGIPLIIDYSWLPVVVLHVWLVSQFYLPRRIVLTPWVYPVVGVIMTSLIFASVLIHELSHAVIARLEGIRIVDIQLHVFGGWARLEGEPRTPMAELRVAIAGPVSSFLLALLFLICLLVVQAIPMRSMAIGSIAEVCFYLFWGNLVLAMFNLMPGLPLDGGRVMRALLWHRRKDLLSATRTAKRMGVAIAYMLSSYGIFWGFWRRDILTTIWMLVVGFFLKNAAESDYRQHEQRANQAMTPETKPDWSVSGTVGSVMSAPPVTVPPEMRVSDFIDGVLASHRHTSFPVAREGRLHGILSLERLREVPREVWEERAVSDVMLPINDTLFIPVRASLERAAHMLKGNQLGHLAVVDGDGMLVGYLSLRDLERPAA
jgi:Zn-dependent protease